MNATFVPEYIHLLYRTAVDNPYECIHEVAQGNTGVLLWVALGAIVVGVGAFVVIEIASRIASVKARELARPAAEE